MQAEQRFSINTSFVLAARSGDCLEISADVCLKWTVPESFAKRFVCVCVSVRRRVEALFSG